MNKEIFILKKNELIDVVESSLNRKNISKGEKIPLTLVLELLSQYSYENRLLKKGLLSHTIIDSLELDYSIGEKLIRFDRSIE